MHTCLSAGTQRCASYLVLLASGVPDDIFLHDVTEHVDYQGEAYDLAGMRVSSALLKDHHKGSLSSLCRPNALVVVK
jgi:hypothetical protein